VQRRPSTKSHGHGTYVPDTRISTKQSHTQHSLIHTSHARRHFYCTLLFRGEIGGGRGSGTPVKLIRKPEMAVEFFRTFPGGTFVVVLRRFNIPHVAARIDLVFRRWPGRLSVTTNTIFRVFCLLLFCPGSLRDTRERQTIARPGVVSLFSDNGQRSVRSATSVP